MLILLLLLAFCVVCFCLGWIVIGCIIASVFAVILAVVLFLLRNKRRSRKAEEERNAQAFKEAQRIKEMTDNDAQN